MPRFAFIPLAALALCTFGPALAQQPPAPPETFSCTGPFGPKSTHADVAAAFGKDNVVFRLVDGAEGEKIAATVLFPKDPKRRLQLFWADEKKRAGLTSVRPDPANRIAAPNGVRPGMSLADVEKLNGRPFALSGFGWDYGGSVVDWKEGALAAPAPGGCVVSVRFALPPNAPDPVSAKVAGDTDFASNDAKMKAAKPIVDQVSFGWPVE